MKTITLSLIALLFTTSLFSQTTISQTTNGTYTWTCPAGVTSVKVDCWGAGGAGGGATLSGTHRGGGGAGGSFASNSSLSVTPGVTYTYVVGKGGTGSFSDGTNGGNSTFNSTDIVATGGAGGIANDGAGGSGSSSGCIGATIYSGGNGQSGSATFGTGGGGAGSAGNGGDGSISTTTGGTGASTGGGNGGDGLTTRGIGKAGVKAGGGGGGALTNSGFTFSGGTGADGRVDITYSCITYSITNVSVLSECRGTGATISLTGSTANLPVGTYTVTYNLGGANTGTSLTATMTVTTAGTGTFATATLSYGGSTTLTVTKLTSGSCNSTISTNNTLAINVSSPLSGLVYTHSSATYCVGSAITSNTVLSISGYGTITYSISPSLPSGLSINSTTGTISGTPTVSSATTNYTVTASNDCGSTTATITITVATALSGLTYTYPGPLSYCVGISITNNTVATISGAGTITYSISPSLPAGLFLTASTGTISGMPTAASGSTNYTVTASNGCSSTSVVLNITTNSGSAITASNDGPVCIGSTIHLSVTAISGATYYWSGPKSSSSTLQNPSFTYAATSAGTYTIVVKPATGCPSLTTTTVSAPTAGQWKGNTSSNWGSANNWCDGQLPLISTNVTIPTTATNMPVVSDNEYVKNLVINSGGTLNISSGGTLNIAGSITNSGTFSSSLGAVSLSGTTAQTIPASTFQNNDIYDLIINNSSASGVTLGGALKAYHSLTFGGTGMIFNTNDNLTLRSTASETAWVGDVTGNTINGKVIVERYLQAKRGWRLLSVPTNTSQTIQQAWQEGCGAGVNCSSGYGTIITGPGGTGAGFDILTSTSSMKTYNSPGNTYVGTTATNSGGFTTQNGYMIFFRGDRSVTTASAAATTTTLRTKGTLYTGTQPAVSVGALSWAVIGNPYASAIDMRNISKTGMKDFFYVWDPNLSGSYGLGGFQTFTNDGSGNYIVIPGGGSYGTSGSISNYIQSGQAFFMQGGSSGGSVTMTESAKTSGSSVVNAPAGLTQPSLNVTLYGVNPSGNYVADGIMLNYGEQYSNNIDDLDAVKSSNSSENLASKRGNSLLAVERRQPIILTDTINLNMTNMMVQQYYFEINSNGLHQPGLTGYLKDNFTGTQTPLVLDGTTTVNFTTTSAAASRAVNRFTIIFNNTPTGILPITFNSISATKYNSIVNVKWIASNDVNVEMYYVQRSIDGTHFTTIATTSPLANNASTSSYQVADSNYVGGVNFYRIMSIDKDGKINYSSSAKINIENNKVSGISIFPNPVKDNIIHLHLSGKPAGMYHLQLLNKNGQLIAEQIINNPGGEFNQTMKLPASAASGIYNLEISGSNGIRETMQITK